MEDWAKRDDLLTGGAVTNWKIPKPRGGPGLASETWATRSKPGGCIARPGAKRDGC
jgi:hypothetical protein